MEAKGTFMQQIELKTGVTLPVVSAHLIRPELGVMAQWLDEAFYPEHQQSWTLEDWAEMLSLTDIQPLKLKIPKIPDVFEPILTHFLRHKNLHQILLFWPIWIG